MTIPELRELAEDCLNNGTLTKLEDSFLVGIMDKIDRRYRLSEREEEKLNEIHHRMFSR